MQTLGIDLAAQSKNTAACVIEWADAKATIQQVAVPVTDVNIVAMAANCDAVGIDSPFGWPLPLIAFLKATHPVAAPPAKLDGFADKDLRYRRTDLETKQQAGIYPLAVGMDKLASVAVRCLRLQSVLGITAKGGDVKFYEVYPAASLTMWGNPRGTPLPAALATLELKCLCLELDDAAKQAILGNRHIFDAFIAALTVRAAILGHVLPIPAKDADIASSDGWIHLPTPAALGLLC